MSTIQIAVSDIACSSCIVKIKKGIKKMHGVEDAKIVEGSARLQVLFNEQILKQHEIVHHLQHLAFRAFD